MEYSTSTDIKSYTAIIGEQWAMMSDNRCIAAAASAWRGPVAPAAGSKSGALMKHRQRTAD